jgi:putative copper export protein
MLSNYQFWITIAVLLLSIGVIVYTSWVERRPRTTLKTRLIPTTTIIIIFGFIALLALVHLANLYGIHTGRRIR